MTQGALRPGFITGGVVTAIVLGFVLGPFVVPAVIGAWLIGGIALSQGVAPARAIGLAVAGLAILLVAGMVAAYLIVPTARVAFDRPDFLDRSARDRTVVLGPAETSP